MKITETYVAQIMYTHVTQIVPENGKAQIGKEHEAQDELRMQIVFVERNALRL